MKKAMSLVLAFAMVLSLAACGGSSSAPAASSGAASTAASTATAQPVAGVCWYNFGDTFIANARQTLNDAAAADGTVKVIDADSQNDVATQTSNMNNFYTQGVNYLVLNNINNNAITELIQQAKDKGVTLIFFGNGGVKYWVWEKAVFMQPSLVWLARDPMMICLAAMGARDKSTKESRNYIDPCKLPCRPR